MAKQDTRERIKEAATQLFARYGFKKTTVDDIAREAAVGKGTVYLYFTSKEAIAIDVMLEANRAIQAKLRTIAHSKAAPPVKIKNMLITRVMERVDRIQNYVDSIGDFLVKAKAPYDELKQQVASEESQIFAEILIEGRLAGCFVVDEPFSIARAMIAATEGLNPTVLSRKDLLDRKQVETMVKQIADLLLDGISTRAD